MFWGRFKSKVDKSRRVVVPKPFRDICGDYVMASRFGNRLMCYRLQEWKELEKEHKSEGPWWRFIAAAYMYRIDGKGRILLLESPYRRSPIDKAAVFLGCGDHFEMCSFNSLMDSPR